MQMNWDDGRLFLEVARQGQMKKAALKLGITPVTLTRRIAAFEARMGAPLFIRRSVGVDLSDDGQRIFEALERAEAEMLSVSAKIDASSEISGTIRLALPDGFLHGFVLPNLERLYEQHPALSLELVPLPRHLSLMRREADMAVFVGKPQDARIWSTPLTHYQLGLFASLRYLERFGSPAQIDDLRYHRLIGFVPDLLAQDTLDYAKEAYANWQSHYAMPSAISQTEAVAKGAGIGMLHTYLEGTNALERLFPEIQIERSYYAATHANLRLQPRMKALFAFLKQVTAGA